MDSKLKCVFALPPGQEQNNVEEPKYETKFENTRSQVAAAPKSDAKVQSSLLVNSCNY